MQPALLNSLLIKIALEPGVMFAEGTLLMLSAGAAKHLVHALVTVMFFEMCAVNHDRIYYWSSATNRRKEFIIAAL